MTVALNHEEIGENPERKTKIKLFIGKYNQRGMNYPSEENDLEKSEKKI